MDIRKILERLYPHIVVGIEGTALTRGERSILEKSPPAGVIIMPRNVSGQSQLRKLTADLIRIVTSSSGRTPLVMADHEGGRTSVLSEAIGTPPSQMASWKQGDRALFEAQLRETARRMVSSGINMTLAPVADVDSEPLNPIIGTRAYSDKTRETAEAVGIAVRVLSEEGLLTSLKHFPGHGSSVGDSHLSLPQLERSVEQLRKDDIIPFAGGIDAGADSVMTAHIAPAGKDIPASLDPEIVTGVLRNEIGFDRVVITDALEMAGILSGRGLSGSAYKLAPGPGGPGPGQAGTLKPAAVARSALEAGNDLLLFSRPAEEVYRELQDILPLLSEDERFWEEEFVRMSSGSRERIFALREMASCVGSDARGGKWNDDFYSRVAKRTVRVSSDPGGMLPLKEGARVLPVFCGEKRDFDYYTVREFVSTFCRAAGPAPVLDEDRIRPVSGGAKTATGEEIELVTLTPAFDGDPDERVLVLLNRRPLSSECLGRLTAGCDLAVVCESPIAESAISAENTVIYCMGISADSAVEAARLLFGGDRNTDG